MTSEQYARTRRHHERHAGAPNTHDPRATHRGNESDVGHYSGRRVLDEHGLALGLVTDVIYDASGVSPQYLVVDPGPLRAAHYVPVAGSYSTADDQLVVSWDKQWVRHAPKARRDHILSRADRETLEVHYPVA